MKSLKASDIDRMQLMRLTQYPIKMQDDLIVANELEHGILKIYKCAGGALDMHLLFADIDEWKNADLVAKITRLYSERLSYETYLMQNFMNLSSLLGLQRIKKNGGFTMLEVCYRASSKRVMAIMNVV